LVTLLALLALSCDSKNPTSPDDASCPPGQWAADTGGAYQRDPWGYLYVLKHELTHVFQFTLTNCPSNHACPTWLVDAEKGHGATIQDMKDMFQYLAEGDSFHGAFERALGISVTYLEENFFSLMEAYLE